MKKNKLVSIATLAFAMLAAPFAAFGVSDGNIVDIRAVDTAGMKFGGPTGRNQSSMELCSAENPLLAGSKLYIRVRLLDTNYGEVIKGLGKVEPKVWRFLFTGLGSEYLNTPKLGLSVGNHVVYADFVENGPEAWQKSACALDHDEVGNSSDTWNYYTDFYFCYTVKAGDIGLPVKLLGTNGLVPKSLDAAEFCLYNVNTGAQVYRLVDANPADGGTVNDVKFYYGTDINSLEPAPDWPSGIDGDQPIRTYDLAAEGVFVKTVDFDRYNSEGGTWSEGDIWREVYPNSSEVPGMTPAIVIDGGSEIDGVNTIWVWTTNDVVRPIGTGAIKTESGYYAMPITISPRSERVTFALAGGASAKIGDVVTIFMGPTKNDVYTPVGNLIGTTVQRQIKVVQAPPPYVNVMINGEHDATMSPVVSDFNKASATLQVRLSQAYGKDVEVLIHPTLPTAATEAWNKYVGLSAYAEGGLADFKTNLVFTADEMAAGTLVKTLQIYTLGADDFTSAAPNGITFVADVTEKNDARAAFSDNKNNINATLYLKPVNPIVTTPEQGQKFADILGAAIYNFDFKIADTYKNLLDKEGYTVIFRSGATGSTNEVITCAESANGKWHFGTDGTLVENGGVISVRYPGDGGTFISELSVIGPDGKKSTYTGGTKVEPVKIDVTVEPAAKISAVVEKKGWNEGDIVPVNFAITRTNGRTMYAFLRPLDEDTAKNVSGDGIISTNGFAIGGAEIPMGDMESADSIYVRLLDGTNRDLGGLRLRFEIVLCTDSEYDPTKIVDGYTSSALNLNVYNVEPIVKKVERAAGGQVIWNSPSDEPTFPMAISKDVKQKFFISNLKEPGEIDKKVMNMRWQVQEFNEEGSFVTGDTKEFQGKVEDFPFEYTFSAAGYSEIEIKIWDKDMDAGSIEETYKFTVNVSGQPSVFVRENLETFSELDNTGFITVELSNAATDPIIVRATVTPYEDSKDVGRFSLDPVKRESQAVENVYLLTFNPGTSTSTQNILSFADLDGTLGSQTKGWRVSLEIATDVMQQRGYKLNNPDGIPYSTYYICEDGRVYVSNDAPMVVAPISNEPIEEKDKGWLVSDGLETAHSITFTVSNDAAADIEAGFWVTFYNSNPANVDGKSIIGVLDNENYTGGRVKVSADEPHIFSPMFGPNPGAAEVSLKVEDKDYNAGTTPFERTWYYEVQAAKHLLLSASGPGGGLTAGAAVYSYAKGLGFGHVFSNVNNNPSYMGNFTLDYNCGSKMSVTVYGFGYKVATPIDAGGLDNGFDVPISVTGGSPAGGNYYNYVTDTHYASPGNDGLDSFFYAWVGESTGGSGGGGGGEGEAMLVIKPEKIEVAAKAQSVALPEDNAGGDTGGGTSSTATSYPDTIYDAVFSKEFRAADNRGDINQDGIPDVSVSQYGFGVLDAGAEATAAGGELVNLAKFNEDEDYLPALPSAALTAVGTVESWQAAQIPFTAIYEIRGYHPGLNIRNVSDMDLSEVELRAFKRYVAKYSLGDPENAGQLKALFKTGVWTPENPTDPTLDDTDADGMPDGYEYYYWYSAHVYGAKGERYGFWTGDVAKPTVIESEVIETLFNPNVARDWTSGDVDTDGDGLSDLEEFVIGTNPVHWDSDGDGVPDGLEVMRGTDPLKADATGANGNPDKDFMAYMQLSKQLVVELAKEDGSVEVWGYDNANGDGLKYDIARYDDAAACDGMTLVTKNPIDGDTPAYFFAGDETALAKYANAKQVFVDMPVNEVYSTEEIQSNGVKQVRYWLGRETTLNAGFQLTVPVVVTDDAGTLAENEKFGWVKNSECATPVKVAKLGPATSYVDGAWKPADFEVDALTNMVCLYRYGKYDNRAYAIKMACEIDDTTNRVHEIKGTTIVTNFVDSIKSGAGIVRIDANAKVAYMHAQVFAANGFDPRTGWGDCGHGYCGKRWCPTCGGSEAAGTAGAAVNTKAYESYDEHYLMQYRYLNGLRDINRDIYAVNTNSKTLQDIWKETTTAPCSESASAATAGDDADATATSAANTAADTDGDGSPDGWELYVLKNPNDASPTDVTDDEWDELSFAIGADGNPTGLRGDGMTHPAEFLGTDTILMYANCPTIGGSASTWTWLNKFFPTNPYASDTDGDGMTDISEMASDFSTADFSKNAYGDSATKTSFIYGDATDDGSICIRGGGLNPCSVDTDGDHLPDLWEYQFAGVVVSGEGGAYIDFGMDGTDPFDAYTGSRGAVGTEAGKDPRTGTCRNFDFDNDGLQNCDEYLTQVLRHLRYDVMTLGTTVQDPNGALDAPEVKGIMNGTVLSTYNLNYIYGPVLSSYAKPADHVTRRGFFGTSPHGWDLNSTRTANAGQNDRVILTPGTTYSLVATNSFGKAPFMRYRNYVAAKKYATTDPRMFDTDRDGMDDFYELFHGLNPLLGENRDVIAEAYEGLSFLADGMPINCYRNEFTDPNGTDEYGSLSDRALPMDFARFPWLAGMGMADPDGDGLRNNQELIEANGADPQPSNTDPTPLWMTDNSFKYSYTAQYYRRPSELNAYWNGSSQWLFSYEMNEGYDTDNDGLTDGEEKSRTVLGATAPQLFTDPLRRQALYLPGNVDGVPSLAVSYSPNHISGAQADIFRQFTVECWIRPEASSLASNAKCTVIERVCNYPQSNFNSSDVSLLTNVVVNANGPSGMGITADDLVTNIAYAIEKRYVRATFRIGIDGGHVYGLIDNSDARDSEAYVGVSSAKVVSDVALAADKWYHLALTYDGRELAVIVNGQDDADRYGRRNAVESSLIPANGIVDILQNVQYMFPFYSYFVYESAFILGASADEVGIGLTTSPTAVAANYTRQYAGYIGEVRVWDGCRSVAQIAADYKRRLSYDDLILNRNEIYDAKRNGASRSSTAGTAVLPAQLIQQYTFDGLHGATEPRYVATAPAAFTLNVTEPASITLSEMNGEDIQVEVGWLAEMDDSIKPTVYTEYGYIPWVKNQVAHLPVFDGSVADSVYWGENLAGSVTAAAAGVNKFAFPRTANPYVFLCNASDVSYRMQRYSVLGLGSLGSLYSFDVSSRASATSDLVPLGCAFAKRCTDFWDGQGAMDADVLTAYNGATDEKANGLPDWWEEYCRDQYCYDDWDPSAVLTLDTWVNYYGTRMHASEAYLRDLAKGMLPPNKYEQAFENVADFDNDGLPDWWEDLYGINTQSTTDGKVDSDNDGLSNMAEYILSEKFDLGLKFSPKDARSGGSGAELDYFHKVGSLYVGEIFADHDHIEDWWEGQYGQDYVSTLVYDTKTDNDDDGWSAWAEARYSQQVSPIVANNLFHYDATDGYVPDYPVPTVQLRVKYNGSKLADVEGSSLAIKIGRALDAGKSYEAEYYVTGKALAKASEGSEGGASSAKQTAATSNDYKHVIGRWSNRHVLGTLTPGFINANSISLQGAYNPSSVTYSWTVLNQFAKRGSRVEYEQDVRTYGANNVVLMSKEDGYVNLNGIEVRTDLNSEVATLRMASLNRTLGTVDLKTGEYDIDLGVLSGLVIYNPTNTSEVAAAEDQTYRLVYSANPSTGVPRDVYLGEADTGRIREGKNMIMVWADFDGNKTWNAGEPFGYVRNFEVGWRKNSAVVELFDMSPVSPRLDISTVETDRAPTLEEFKADLINKCYTAGVTEKEIQELLKRLAWLDANPIETVAIESGIQPNRIRVVRWAVDGEPVYNVGVNAEVVLDKEFYLNNRTFITEADFLADGLYDLDWANFKNDVVDNFSVQMKGLAVTNVAYLVVVGDGSTGWKSVYDTNTVVKAIDRVIVRNYDRVQAQAVTVAPGSAASVVYSAKPTFKWRVPGSDVSGYPAFRLQVLGAGNRVVWDSGVRLAPARDSEGNYVWEAPVYVGEDLASSVNYKWRVSALNAKFTDPKWSAAATFRMEPAAVGSDVGKIRTQVKYYGPAEVLAGGTIRIEAYTSPDFTGDPAGRITASATNTTVEMLGLAKGTYYLRAFVDSVKYGEKKVRDDWESWGYYCNRSGATDAIYTPVAAVIDGQANGGDIFTIYIEDADVNGNRLPDAWEYETLGRLSDGTESIDDVLSCGLAINAALSGSLKSLESSTEYDFAIAHLYQTLSTKGMASLILGVSPNALEAVNGQLQVVNEVTGVAIDSLGFDADGDVVIKVSGSLGDVAEVAPSAIYGQVAATALAERAVTVEVQAKTSLAEAGWQTIATKTIMVGGDAQKVELGAIDASSCYLRVVVRD